LLVNVLGGQFVEMGRGGLGMDGIIHMIWKKTKIVAVKESVGNS
jgi:hypothetical protein